MSVHDRPDWMMDECWVEAQPTFKDAGKNRSRDGQGHASKSEERLYLKKVFTAFLAISPRFRSAPAPVGTGRDRHRPAQDSPRRVLLN